MTRTRLEGRQIGGLVIVLLGVAMVLSALSTNPWAARLTRGPAAIDYADVLWLYFPWALALGAAAILLGRKVARGKSWADGFSMLFLLLAIPFLADRYLLARLGLPLWKYDPEIRYVHRPGAVRSLTRTGRPGDFIRINRWGFHDTDFPRTKPAGELRGLMLGDSVTMGHGVTYEETFCKQLEDLLAAHDKKHRSHQIINAGVHGYSTFQELTSFERALDLSPDFVVIGFCLNDVTEPFVVDIERGGTGLDYHGVTQNPNAIAGYLQNETGTGRLLQKLSARGKSQELEKRREVYNVREMALESRTNPVFVEAWEIVLADLGRVYDLAAEHDLPVLLLVFPFTFQLNDPATHAPQEILAEHAAGHGVEMIDFTPVFSEAIYQESDVVELLERRGRTPEEIARFFRWRIREYFFDQDHFTATGNALIAPKIYDWMEARDLVSPIDESSTPNRDGEEPGR